MAAAGCVPGRARNSILSSFYEPDSNTRCSRPDTAARLAARLRRSPEGRTIGGSRSGGACRSGLQRTHSDTDSFYPHRLHLAPKKLRAREDAAALGRYAAGLEDGVKERTLFVGDFNLAPVKEKGMNPDPECAFEGLSAAGFHPANFEPTNLCALGRSGGRVYDNVLAHESCTSEEGGVFSLAVDACRAEGRPGQRAYVFPMDDLLLKSAYGHLNYPRAWVLEGLVGAAAAAAAAPKPATPAAPEGDEDDEESDDEDEPAEEGGAAAAAAAAPEAAVKTRTAANGLCSLGLFDHRFLFVELIPR